MAKVKLTSIGMTCDVDERVVSDWRFLDLMTTAQDPDKNDAEKFWATNKGLKMMLGAEQKAKLIDKIAKNNDGYATVETVLDVLGELATKLGSSKKK